MYLWYRYKLEWLRRQSLFVDREAFSSVHGSLQKRSRLQGKIGIRGGNKSRNMQKSVLIY